MMRPALAFARSYFALLVVLAVFAWSAYVIATRRAEEAPQDTITLRIGHWQLESGVRDGLSALAADYQGVWRKQWESGGKNAEGRQWRQLYPDKPNVRVLQDAIPETTYGQWVSTQLMGGTAPDMMEIWLGLPYPIWRNYLGRYFVVLDSYADRPNPHNAGTDMEGVPLRKTYKDGMRGAFVEELQAFMNIPVSQFAVRIFYNRHLLRKLTGLAKPPTDYRAFLAACEKIRSQKTPQGKPYTPIAASAYHFNMWETMLFNAMTYGATRRIDFNRDCFVGNDEVYVGFETGRVSFDFAPYRGKFQMAREVSGYFQNGYTGLNRDDAVFLFAQEKAVFITTGTWDARSLEEQARGKFEVGVAEFPLPQPADPAYGHIIEGPIYERPGSAACFGIVRTSKYPDVAADFLLFVASKRGNEKLNAYFGWIPAIKDTRKDPLLEDFEPHLEGVYDAMNMNLGGETYIKWLQVFSKYKVDPQYSTDDLAKEFLEFYRQRAPRDWKELQKQWRDEIQASDQYLAGLRARALVARGGQARAEWVKYRVTTAGQQVWRPLQRARLEALLAAGQAPRAVGPYEYTPHALGNLRERIARQGGGPPP
jgi:raffinose/stachyose/melibiose transport system substrate-binding protein